jgi:hypothetical protein
LIGERVARLSADLGVQLAYQISEWLALSAEALLKFSPKTFSAVWDRLVSFLLIDGGKSSVIRSNNSPDWAMEAINAPVGKLVDALMDDPSAKGLTPETGFPVQWLKRAESLLTLPGDGRRHAIVMFVFNLSWFFHIDPNWTEKYLLPVLEHEGLDKEAFWAGFFWAAKLPGISLYPRLQPHLIQLAKSDGFVGKSHSNVLAGMLLAGWGSIGVGSKQFITDDEISDVLIHAGDDLRSSILWQLERWSTENPDWRKKVVMFLHVWPRQKSARTPAVTARLCDLAFEEAGQFPQIVDAILPLVTTVGEAHFLLRASHGKDDGKPDVVQEYPDKTLALLWAVLAEDVSTWPYGTADVIEKIATANPALKLDARFIELQRRWNSR